MMKRIWQYCKERMHVMCFIIIGVYVLNAFGHAVLEGVERNITQHQIDETYKISR